MASMEAQIKTCIKWLPSRIPDHLLVVTHNGLISDNCTYSISQHLHDTNYQYSITRNKNKHQSDSEATIWQTKCVSPTFYFMHIQHKSQQHYSNNKINLFALYVWILQSCCFHGQMIICTGYYSIRTSTSWTYFWKHILLCYTATVLCAHSAQWVTKKLNKLSCSTHVYSLFSCTSDHSCLRQSILCSRLLRDAGYHWNAQYQGLQSWRNNRTLNMGRGWGAASFQPYELKNCVIDSLKKQNKKVGNKEKAFGQQGRVRGTHTHTKMTELPVSKVQCSKLWCVSVNQRKKELERKQTGEDWEVWTAGNSTPGFHPDRAVF